MQGKRPVPGKEDEAQTSAAPQIESAKESSANGDAFSQAAGSSFVSVMGRNLWHKRKGRGRASNKAAANSSTLNESLTPPEILRASQPKSDELDAKHTTRPTANPSTHQPVHQPTHESSHDTSNYSSYDSKPTNQSFHNNIIKAAVSHWVRFTRVQIALRARNEKLKRDALLKWRGYHLMRWRQNIRATVQHRMATCLVFWRVWNMRIQIAKLDQANMDTAKNRANLTLVRTTLNYWLMYNNHRRIQNLKKRFALNSRKSMLSTRVFKLWRDKFRFRRHIQLLDQQSIHFESTRISKSHFSHWLLALRKRRELDAKVARSKAKLGRISLDQTFSAWKEFLRAMKRKHDMRGFQIFSVQKAVMLTDVATLASQKRTLQHLSILKGWRIKAELFHDNLTAQKAFQQWKTRYHTSIRAREALILLPAADHHKNHLLRRCLKSWVEYKNQEKSDKELERRAIEWNRKRILDSSFKHISRQYTFNAIKRKMEILAHENWKFSILEKLFHHWMESCQERFRERLYSKKIERFRKHLLTRRYFEALAKNADIAFMERQKEKTHAAVQARQLQQEAEKQKDRNTLRKWIIYHDMMAAKALKKASADLFCVDSTRRKAFGVWKTRLSQSMSLKVSLLTLLTIEFTALIRIPFVPAEYLTRRQSLQLKADEMFISKMASTKRSKDRLEDYLRRTPHNSSTLLEPDIELATRDGVMYWMLGVDVVRKVREGYQAAESFRTNQLELKKAKKFALRWRAKTAASKKTSRRHGGYGHPPVQTYDSHAVWINNRMSEGGAFIPKVTGSEGNYSVPATSLQHASIHVSRLNSGASHSSRPKPRKPAFLDDFLLPKQ
ncbi:hypothetical protein BJ741DRAFT_712269 [Chytriomyces cf. hyalinus JEL632]|nr:hypothetical protein BJ741DRAFT_712269 [Chytriomyces cf. hyalinus JEL632]